MGKIQSTSEPEGNPVLLDGVEMKEILFRQSLWNRPPGNWTGGSQPRDGEGQATLWKGLFYSILTEPILDIILGRS